MDRVFSVLLGPPGLGGTVPWDQDTRTELFSVRFEAAGLATE